MLHPLPWAAHGLAEPWATCVSRSCLTYFHGGKTKQTADNYTVFFRTFQEHVSWSLKRGCIVSRADRIPIRKAIVTDPWIQSEGSVRLFTLWVCARSFEEMVDLSVMKAEGCQ